MTNVNSSFFFRKNIMTMRSPTSHRSSTYHCAPIWPGCWKQIRPGCWKHQSTNLSLGARTFEFIVQRETRSYWHQQGCSCRCDPGPALTRYLHCEASYGLFVHTIVCLRRYDWNNVKRALSAPALRHT